MSLDLVQIYLIVLCGAVGIPLLLLATSSLRTFLGPNLRQLHAKMSHSVLTFWPRTSHAQTILMILYIGVNGAVLAFGIKREGTLSIRASLIATANMMVLFLGGKTNPWSDYVQVSLDWYYLVHRCVAVVAICEALLHSSIELYHRPPANTLSLSGYIAAGSLVAILVSAIWPGRHLGRFYGKLHLLFYITILLGLLWHTLFHASTLAKIPAITCGSIWAATHIYRLSKMFLLGHGYAEVIHTSEESGCTRLVLNIAQPIKFYPGCYFYIFFPGPLPFYDFLHGYAMMPFWAGPKPVNCNSTSELSFLISHTQAHVKASRGACKGQHVRLEGPYGRDPKLHTFETVVLAAKGMGIVGVLPFAFHLAERRKHDDDARNKSSRLRDSNEVVFGDLSRNVDLIWWLESNDQQEWVAKQLKQLQRMDTKGLLVVWCIYPDRRNVKPPFQKNDYWKARYDFDSAAFARELRQEARYPGKNVLLACGDAAFVGSMRQVALENTSSDRFIKFEKIDFRPLPLELQNARQYKAQGSRFMAEQDVELQRAQPGDAASHPHASWSSQETITEQSIVQPRKTYSKTSR